jgi:hypothetical protein
MIYPTMVLIALLTFRAARPMNLSLHLSNRRSSL